MRPLQGITIIDFTRLLPGPLATNLLAQLGAEVIKIEHPRRGDYARSQPPFAGGESTLFAGLNFAKEIRTIDYEDEEGRSELLLLVQQADVVVEQFRPGAMASWKLGYAHLKEVNPELIYVSLSGYGQDGPYRNLAGHDLNYLAYSGVLSLIRDQEGRPVIPGVQVADIASGSYLTMTAVLTALLQRERTGSGAYVDVSMLDGLLPLLTVPATQQWGGFDPYTVNFLSGALVNYNVYRCAGGKWIALGALEIKFWNNFCELVDRPDWKRQHHLELSGQIFPKKELEEMFLSRTQEEWLAMAAGHDVCLSPVNNLGDLDRDPQLRHRGGIVNFETEAGNRFKSFGVPFKIS